MLWYTVNLGAMMGWFFSLMLGLVTETTLAQTKQVTLLLDTLHKSASQANHQRYFSLFADDAVFIGTAIEETWTIAEFKSLYLPYFKQGKGWTYLVKSRSVHFSKDKKVAWFEEILQSESYGPTRGTGVLVFENKRWLIKQYHLTIPIPNQLAKSVAQQIKALSK